MRKKPLLIGIVALILGLFSACNAEESSSVKCPLSLALTGEITSMSEGITEAGFIEYLAAEEIFLEIVFDTHRETRAVTDEIVTCFSEEKEGYNVTFSYQDAVYCAEIPFDWVVEAQENHKSVRERLDGFFPREYTLISDDTQKEAVFAAVRSAYFASLAYKGDLTFAQSCVSTAYDGWCSTVSQTDKIRSYNAYAKEYFYKETSQDKTGETLVSAEKVFSTGANSYRYNYADGQTSYTKLNAYNVEEMAQEGWLYSQLEDYGANAPFLADSASELQAAYETVFAASRGTSLSYPGEKYATPEILYKENELIIRETLCYFDSYEERIERRFEVADGKLSRIRLRVAHGSEKYDNIKLYEYGVTLGYTFDLSGYLSIKTSEPDTYATQPYFKQIAFTVTDGVTLYGSVRSDTLDLAFMWREILKNIGGSYCEVYDYNITTEEGELFNVEEMTAEAFMAVERLSLPVENLYLGSTAGLGLVRTLQCDWAVSKPYEIVFGQALKTETRSSFDYEDGKSVYLGGDSWTWTVNGKKISESFTGKVGNVYFAVGVKHVTDEQFNLYKKYENVGAIG
ncbi:MAG: hypothetical protein IJX88_00515 [Clostridia bacterium]|nr:hypothetical protein [Clostridia bacterium]